MKRFIALLVVITTAAVAIGFFVHAREAQHAAHLAALEQASLDADVRDRTFDDFAKAVSPFDEDLQRIDSRIRNIGTHENPIGAIGLFVSDLQSMRTVSKSYCSTIAALPPKLAAGDRESVAESLQKTLVQCQQTDDTIVSTITTYQSILNSPMLVYQVDSYNVGSNMGAARHQEIVASLAFANVFNGRWKVIERERDRARRALSSERQRSWIDTMENP